MATSPPRGATAGNVMQDLIAVRLSRRQALRLGVMAGTVAGLSGVLPRVASRPAAALPLATGSIPPVPATSGAAEALAGGLQSEVLVRWGDPIVPGAPAFDLLAQSASAQATQFGFNCDYTALLPDGEDVLLWVNHEYTSGEAMFVGYPAPAGLDSMDPAALAEWVDVELEAHGGTVLRLRHVGNRFEPDLGAAVNRRITATTPMRLAGPAGAIVGTAVTGMLNNCAGGYTPWGTILTAEENFNQYFANAGACPDPVLRADHLAFGVPSAASERRWERVHARFDTTVAPLEPWRFGYVVEIDPADPASVPVKRTALGRLKHEGANTAVAPDGRVAVYTGDDERFQYVYKFVTDRAWDPADRAANLDLLDNGVLHVARFDASGTGTWLPLQYAGNEAFWNGLGFAGQADLCVRTRAAAAALGATRMDRPEDIEISPATGYVYLACTNNGNRGDPGQPGLDAANPRKDNNYGHIIELVEDGDDAAALTFRWDVFMLCGDGRDPSLLVASPQDATTTEQTWFAGYAGPTTLISSPDNLAFDQAGNLYIGTDGQPGSVAHRDGVFVVPTAGRERGKLEQLYAGPAGCEVTGPFLFGDDKILLVAIQHPGEGGFAVPADPRTNATRWPDGDFPRPSVVQITRADGAKLVGTPTAKVVPLAPTRILDTRDRTGVATTGPLAADRTLDLELPLSREEQAALAAVVVTTTLTDAGGPGYVTVHPAATPRPYASALNVERVGQTKANLVTVAVGPTGGLSFYTYGGGHLVADLDAVYLYVAGSSDGRYQPLAPTRLFDTRDGLGGVPTAKVGAGATLAVTVAGRAGVPAAGAGAVLLNVTVTEPAAAGYLSVFPDGSVPNSSNVNWSTGETVANQVLVPLGADGRVRFHTYAETHVLADVAGWITDASAPVSDVGLFVPVTPARVRDTRDGRGGPAGKVEAGGVVTAPVAGVAGVPSTGVAAVVANLTFTEADAPGYVTAWPTGTPRPYASSINADAAGQTVANHLTVPVGTDGSISLYVQPGGHVVVDVTGWYTA